MSIKARIKKIEQCIGDRVHDNAVYTIHVGADEINKYTKTIDGVTINITAAEWHEASNKMFNGKNFPKSFEVIEPIFNIEIADY